MTSIFFIVNGLILAGGLLLIAALLPVVRLIRQLPAGSVRTRWQILTLFMVVFIVGYFTYAVVHWGNCCTVFDLVVPAVFFLGAIFVEMVCSLALRTAIDIKRICTLEQETITDPLMGIFNRRYLERRLNEEMARAQRYGLPLAVLLLDVDFFKKINDTYGHQAGDQVLQQLGHLLLDFVREADIVARYGGEEILVILPNTALEAATQLAERLRQTVAASIMVATGEGGGRQEISLTVSVGVAGFSQQTPDSHVFMTKADRALYRAKDEGRNRVVVSNTVAS